MDTATDTTIDTDTDSRTRPRKWARKQTRVRTQKRKYRHGHGQTWIQTRTRRRYTATETDTDTDTTMNRNIHDQGHGHGGIHEPGHVNVHGDMQKRTHTDTDSDADTQTWTTSRTQTRRQPCTNTNMVDTDMVIFDSSLTFSDHATQLAGRCYYYLRQIRGIRRSLTVDSCHALVRALILSRLDYCNSLLCGNTDLLMAQLDGVLRAAARVVLQLPRRSIYSITAVMRDRLHWLDISSRIKFKLCVLVRRCSDGSAICVVSLLPCLLFRLAPTCVLLLPVI